MAGVLEQCRQINRNVRDEINIGVDDNEQLKRYFAEVTARLDEQYNLLVVLHEKALTAGTGEREAEVAELQARHSELNHEIKLLFQENEQFRVENKEAIAQVEELSERVELYEKDEQLAADVIKKQAARVSVLEAENAKLSEQLSDAQCEKAPDELAELSTAEMMERFPGLKRLAELHTKMQEDSHFKAVFELLASGQACVFTLSQKDEIHPILFGNSEMHTCLSPDFGIEVYDDAKTFRGHDLFAYDPLQRIFGFTNCQLRGAVLLQCGRFVYLQGNNLEFLDAGKCALTEIVFLKGSRKLKFANLVVNEGTKVDWDM